MVSFMLYSVFVLFPFSVFPISLVSKYVSDVHIYDEHVPGVLRWHMIPDDVPQLIGTVPWYIGARIVLNVLVSAR